MAWIKGTAAKPQTKEEWVFYYFARALYAEYKGDWFSAKVFINNAIGFASSFILIEKG